MYVRIVEVGSLIPSMRRAHTIKLARQLSAVLPKPSILFEPMNIVEQKELWHRA